MSTAPTTTAADSGPLDNIDDWFDLPDEFDPLGDEDEDSSAVQAETDALAFLDANPDFVAAFLASDLGLGRYPKGLTAAATTRKQEAVQQR